MIWILSGFLRFSALLSLSVAMLALCAGASAAEGFKGRQITVAAASDLAFALKDISALFEGETGGRVVISFGSTGMFTRQIEQGAPFDLFFSAGEAYMDRLKKSGYTVSGTERLYARGALALAVSRGTGIKVPALGDLTRPEIKRIVIANPDHAPYGVAAMETLRSAGLLPRVKEKIVYAENIRQAMQYLQTGDAQAGLIALSLATADQVTYSGIDARLHGPINQVAALIKGSADEEAARAFLEYVCGPKGRQVLKRYGFTLP